MPQRTGEDDEHIQRRPEVDALQLLAERQIEHAVKIVEHGWRRLAVNAGGGEALKGMGS